MSKRLPVLDSDEKAERFLEGDLSEYISSENLAPYPFEFRAKQKSINLRISEELLEAVRARAKQSGMPYQRFIRQALEKAVGEAKS
jgi:predicted DNA binding CopG/RHH family protein